VEFNQASDEAGDYKYTGKAYITSCTLNAPNEDAATYSISLQGTGALTIATN
jgi:predicted secreted protein